MNIVVDVMFSVLH